MPGDVNQFVDFSANTNNDTGENNTASIQPITDGEGVTGASLARPSESLRQRTEAIRDVMADTLYLRDADRGFVTFCTGGVTWPGSTTNAQTGIPVLTNEMWLVPMLTPGAVQVGAPPIASAFGVLHLKRSSDSADAISVTSMRRSYAAGDQINVTVTSGGSFSCVLDVENGLRRTIKIVATGTTTLGTVISALNGITPPAPDNTQLVTAALEGGASSGDFLLAPQARQRVAGNYDGEAHQISVSTLSSFFSSNPTQALAEGDSLCIRYDMVADLASTGGRRQSIPENTNTAVPAGALFNSRVHPELLTNAIPVCKVLNNKLVFGTGVEVPAGAVAFSLSGSAQGIAYGGGANWADATTNPATTVESQLDKIIVDLGSGSGTAKIASPAVGPLNELAAGTLLSQVTTLVTLINDTKNQNAVRLLDGVLAQLVPGDLGSSGNPERRDVAAGSDNTGTEWCYALTITSGIPIQGPSNNIIKISAGTVFQRVTGVGSQASFIPFTLPGTDQFTIANGNGVNPRVDLVQIRLAWSGTSPSSVVTCTINVKAGTPAATPAYPAPDAGFVALCYVTVGATYAGGSPFGDNGGISTGGAGIHDVRMPLGVRVYVVRPQDMGYNDDAWALDGKAGDTFGGDNLGKKRRIQNIAALTGDEDDIHILCPTNRGRLLSVALMSKQANGATGAIQRLFEPGTAQSVANVNLAFSGAGTNYVRAGLDVLEFTGYTEANGTLASPLNPGGSVPRTAYGPPIWCNGRRWMSPATFWPNITNHEQILYRHFNVFNGGTPTSIWAAMFWVAEGLG